jgi:ribosome-binding factor A
MRHLLAGHLARGEVHDPGLDGRSITVGEVRVSRDLKTATVYAAELGRPLSPEAEAALVRAAGYLGGRLAREMNMKYAPRIRFVADASFDEAARMEGLISQARAALPAAAAAAAAAEGEDADAGA